MKMLITGPDFYRIRSMIAKAFYELGCKVKISNWPDFSGTVLDRSKLLLYNKLNALTKSLDQSEIITDLFEEAIRDYNKELLQEVVAIQPDVLLALRGDILLPKTIEKIRNKSDVILVLWCYDSALRFSNVLKGGKCYHLFYTYEPTDIQGLRKYGIHATYLPMAYDPDTYFKLEDETYIRDISFVGALSDYPERKKILELIISRHKNLKLEIWGTAWTWYNPFLQYEYKIKRRALGKHIHNYNIPPEEVNKVYNATKICLNMHHRQSKEGVNPRTFEILGAGAFQLIDHKKELEKLFDIGREIVCYKNEADLLDKIEYYLENEDERNKIARRGHEIVTNKHTYKHRAETILSDVKTLR
jgi:spore maturation protein CgeB